MLRNAGTALHKSHRYLDALCLVGHNEPFLSRSVTTKTHASPGSLRRKVSSQPSRSPSSRKDARLPIKRAKNLQPSSGIILGDSRRKTRYFNTSKADSGNSKASNKRLLEPHVLSGRLKKLCDARKLEDAVYMLKNAPLDAQNTPVWNTLIWECMKAGRFQLGYQLFTDMKRRGFSATTRTYQTMFKGLSRIEHWSTYPKQLANAHSLYEYFERHIEAVKTHDPDSDELTIRPLASYIKILADAGEHQKMFNVYYSLDHEGRLAPDQYFYTAMFQAIGNRRATTDVIQSATDAKLLWKHMLKASQRSPGFPIDSHAVSMAITALSRGRSTDQNFALEIVRDYLGLTQPNEKAGPSKMSLTTHTLEAALALCNTMRDYRLCLHFAHQVMDRPLNAGEEPILDRHHMEHVLRAYASLAGSKSRTESNQALETLQWMLREEFSGRIGPRIRPAATTFNLVLMACWRGSDWPSAEKAFELMTGYYAVDFRDPRGDESGRAPRMEKRSKGRNLIPDAEAMSSMVRTASATRDRANMRQCLRIVDHFGVNHLFGPPERSAYRNAPPTRKEDKLATFYQSKLAGALVEAVDRVVEGRPVEQWSGIARDEQTRWRRLKARAEEVLKRDKWLNREQVEGQDVSGDEGKIDEAVFEWEKAPARKVSRHAQR